MCIVHFSQDSARALVGHGCGAEGLESLAVAGDAAGDAAADVLVISLMVDEVNWDGCRLVIGGQVRLFEKRIEVTGESGMRSIISQHTKTQ